MFLYVSLLLVIALSYLWLHVTRRYDHIPSFKHRWPIFGHIFRMPSHPSQVLKSTDEAYKQCGEKTAMLWLFLKPILATMDVNHFESVLKSNTLISKGSGYNLLKGWLGTGLLISTGDLWKKRRRLLTPAFHFNILSSNVVIMDQHAQNFVKYLKKSENGNLFEFSSLIKRFSLGLLCETAMGVHYNCLEGNENSSIQSYVNGIDFLTHVVALRFRNPFYQSEFIFKWFYRDSTKYYKNLEFAKSFTRSVIENRIKSLESVENADPSIFLDILIEAYKRNEIDIEGIIDEVNTFMFEGHDTVSSAISWTIYLLGRDVRVQNKAFKEIANLEKDQLKFDDLQKLIYLEYVIKESLRLHPPVPLFIRQIKNDCSLDSCLNIPKNTEFIFHVYQMHRDESVWKNANHFCPERFEEENVSIRNPFAFVPFSGGPRNCIGQRFAMIEMKITLFYLLKEFKFESIHQEDELEEEAEVIHRAGKGIWVKIHDRK